MIKEAIIKLSKRQDLTYKEAEQVMNEIMENTASDVQKAAYLTALSMKGETIDELLYHGYSTISLGYAGLYECVKYMTGKSHTDPEATPFALSSCST